MGRLSMIILLVAVTGLTASAQYAGPVTGSGLDYRNGNVYTSEGVKLTLSTAADYMPEENYRYYRSGKKVFNAAIWTSSVGAVVAVGSFAWACVPPQSPSSAPIIVRQSLVATGIALGCAVVLASIPMYFVGMSRMKTSVNFHPVNLSFVTPSGGIGLALTF